MRRITKLILGLAGATAVAGTALAADQGHILAVALPDGSVAQVRYLGDVPPRLVLVPVARLAAADPFGAVSPFAMLDRMTALMDRQAAAMLQAAATGAPPAMAGQPGRVASYSYTSYSASDGRGCTQSVQLTSLGGQPAKLLRQASAGCAATPAAARPVPAARPAPAAPPAGLGTAPLVRTRYVPPVAPRRPAPVI